jgi:hypothetical protein
MKYFNFLDIAIVCTLTGSIVARVLGHYIFYVCFGYSTLFLWLRLFQLFLVDKSLGILLVSLLDMFQDVFQFVICAAFFVAAFTFAFAQALNSTASPSIANFNNTTTEICEVFWPAVEDGTYNPAYNNIAGYNTTTEIMFTLVLNFLGGDAPFDDMEESFCQESQRDQLRFIWFLVFVFLVLTAIVLINMLVAMMGQTYSNSLENSLEVWTTAFLSSRDDMDMNPLVLPAPLNVICLILWIFSLLYHKLRDAVSAAPDAVCQFCLHPMLWEDVPMHKDAEISFVGEELKKDDYTEHEDSLLSKIVTFPPSKLMSRSWEEKAYQKPIALIRSKHAQHTAVLWTRRNVCPECLRCATKDHVIGSITISYYHPEQFVAFCVGMVFIVPCFIVWGFCRIIHVNFGICFADNARGNHTKLGDIPYGTQSAEDDADDNTDDRINPMFINFPDDSDVENAFEQSLALRYKALVTQVKEKLEYSHYKYANQMSAMKVFKKLVLKKG